MSEEESSSAHGDVEDLVELASMSGSSGSSSVSTSPSTVTASELSTTASSCGPGIAGEKLARLIKQLESFKIHGNDTVTVCEKGVNAMCRGSIQDAAPIECIDLSDDEPPVSSKPKSMHAKIAAEVARGKMANAKARSMTTTSKGPETAPKKGDDACVLPSQARSLSECLLAVHGGFMGCVLGNMFTLPISSFTGGSVQHETDPMPFCLEVLEAMRANLEAPKPFALKEQYVPEVRATRTQNELPPPEDASVATKEVAEDQAAPAKKTWDYSKVRKEFIRACREGTNLDFAAACAAWDASAEKRSYLGGVSLPELKRRKFVDKTCTVNPWA